MKKRVGILTFSFSENSGSVLQTYALQQIVTNAGYDCKIIDYEKNGSLKPQIGQNVFVKDLKKWTPKNICKWVFRMATFPILAYKHNKFQRDYLVCSSANPLSRNDLPALNDSFDKFITGSDQVWNFSSPKVDETYFLDFVTDNDKKVSYAASFGVSVMSEENRHRCAEYLSEIKYPSVRETQGAELYKDITQKDAAVVLDPTLLIDSSVWEGMAVTPRKKSYILVYLLEISAEMENFIDSVSKRHNLEVVRIRRSRLINKKGIVKKIVGPKEWMGYIKNAEIVITNSFHGICFSLVFNKNFYVTMRETENDARIESILSMFGLKDRLIERITDNGALLPPDYNNVKKILAEKREFSKEFLLNALGE